MVGELLELERQVPMQATIITQKHAANNNNNKDDK